MYKLFMPSPDSHWRRTLATISGPLSDRMKAGIPAKSMASASISMTPNALIRRATLIDEADRLADMALKVESGAQAAGIKIALDHAWRKASRIAPQRWGERPAVVVREIAGDQEVVKRLPFLQALEACQEGESAGHPSFLAIEP